MKRFRVRYLPLLAAALTLTAASPAGASEPACADPAHALGVKRVLEIDTRDGPVIGSITRYAHEDHALGPKEVVLTFDDGPDPPITERILAALRAECTKASFFLIGKMAEAYPGYVRREVEEGHTVGTHTWSHPLHINRMTADEGIAEIDKGFAAVEKAAGQPVAPFFRFPGLNDSGTLLNHLQARGIATITVDVVSDDSFIHDPKRIVETMFRRLDARGGGIILFHDIKPLTGEVLPLVLAELKAKGYGVVQLKAKPKASTEASAPPSAGIEEPKAAGAPGAPADAAKEPSAPTTLATADPSPAAGPPVDLLEPARPTFPMDGQKAALRTHAGIATPTVGSSSPRPMPTSIRVPPAVPRSAALSTIRPPVVSGSDRSWSSPSWSRDPLTLRQLNGH